MVRTHKLQYLHIFHRCGKRLLKTGKTVRDAYARTVARKRRPQPRPASGSDWERAECWRHSGPGPLAAGSIETFPRSSNRDNGRPRFAVRREQFFRFRARGFRIALRHRDISWGW